MGVDFTMMVLLSVVAFVAVLILGHSEAAMEFSALWFIAAMTSVMMVLTFFKTMFLLAVMHHLTTLLELLTGKKTDFPPRLELVGTVQRIHGLIKELSHHDD